MPCLFLALSQEFCAAMILDTPTWRQISFDQRRNRKMIRVGIGGWTFEPWRGLFFPAKLPKSKELFHASRHVTSIEVNGTFYSTFKPQTFCNWHDETPDDFIFSLKAPRFAVNRRILGEAGPSIARF